MLLSCFEVKIKVHIAFNPFAIILEPFLAHKMTFEGVFYLISIPAVWAIIEVNKLFSLRLGPKYSLICRQIIYNHFILG